MNMIYGFGDYKGYNMGKGSHDVTLERGDKI